MYTEPQDSAMPSGSGEFDSDIVTEAPLPPAHLSCVPDLSMVMEQSQLLDSFQLPFTEEEESGNQTKKGINGKPLKLRITHSILYKTEPPMCSHFFCKKF